MRYQECNSATCSPSATAWKSVQEALNRAFHENAASHSWIPPMDARETDSSYVIQIDLPGVNTDEIRVALEQNALTIRAERKMPEDGAKTLQEERRKGVFQRSMVFPKGVGGEVRATYINGVLTLEVPKREEDKPRNIAIQFN